MNITSAQELQTIQGTDDLLDTPAAAVYLGGERRPFSENTLRIWRVEGRGPAYLRIMGRIRYRRSDLDKFIAEGHRTRTNGSRRPATDATSRASTQRAAAATAGA